MKKLFLLLALFCLTTSIQAQEAYKTLRSKAIQAVENPDTDLMLKKFNQFKVDALDYMVMKMREVMPDSSVAFLDKEAIAMNNFMTLYLQTLLKSRNEPAAYQVKLIKLFMDASYSNPLFHDDDAELVLSYFSDGNSVTRFSLDTDWRIAFIAVATELKKMK